MHYMKGELYLDYSDVNPEFVNCISYQKFVDDSLYGILSFGRDEVGNYLLRGYFKDKSKSPVINFTFDSNDTLFMPLYHLASDHVFVVDDELSKIGTRYMEVYNDGSSSNVSFYNLDNRENISRFSVFLSRHSEGASEMNKFFDEVITLATEDYHQLTFEEDQVKSMVYGKKNNYY